MPGRRRSVAFQTDHDDDVDDRGRSLHVNGWWGLSLLTRTLLLTRERESLLWISVNKCHDHGNDALARDEQRAELRFCDRRKPLGIKGAKRRNAAATLAMALVVNPVVGLFRWNCKIRERSQHDTFAIGICRISRSCTFSSTQPSRPNHPETADCQRNPWSVSTKSCDALINWKNALRESSKSSCPRPVGQTSTESYAMRQVVR